MWGARQRWYTTALAAVGMYTVTHPFSAAAQEGATGSSMAKGAALVLEAMRAGVPTVSDFERRVRDHPLGLVRKDYVQSDDSVEALPSGALVHERASWKSKAGTHGLVVAKDDVELAAVELGGPRRTVLFYQSASPTNTGQVYDALRVVCDGHQGVERTMSLHGQQNAWPRDAKTLFLSGKAELGCVHKTRAGDVWMTALLRDDQATLMAVAAHPGGMSTFQELFNAQGRLPQRVDWLYDYPPGSSVVAPPYEYSIAKAELVAHVREISGKLARPPEGARLLRVSYTVTSAADRSLVSQPNLVRVRSPSGATYEPDHDLTAHEAIRGSEPWLLVQLHPQVPVSQTAVFVLPEAALRGASFVFLDGNGNETAAVPVVLR